MTVSDLLTLSLKRIGVVARGNVPDADNLVDALSTFNDFIDGCAAENLLIWSETRTTFTITASTRDYFVGSGQAVNVARPVYVQQIGDVSPIRLLDTTSTPNLEIPLQLLTDQMWRSLPMKTATATRPWAAYYNPTFPYGTISLYPTPTSGGTGVFYAPAAMAEFALTDTVLLPPGYRRFLRDAVAVELCPMFDMAASPELRASAVEAKANVMRVNMRLTDLPIDAMWSGTGRSYDIQSDQ